jgi:cell division protein FtsQ
MNPAHNSNRRKKSADRSPEDEHASAWPVDEAEPAPAPMRPSSSLRAQREPRPNTSSARTAARAPTPTKRAGITAAIRRLLGAALFLGLSVGIALSLRHYVRTSPRFALSTVSVQGNERRTESEILEIAGAKTGINIFALDLDVLQRRLMQDPWISEVRVRRRLPATLAIEVKERRAAALVALGETYLASKEGTIIKRLEQGDPTDLPLVTGLTAPELLEDRPGAELAIAKALDIARQFAVTDIAQKHPLQEVHVSKDGTWSLVVGKSGIRMQLGNSPFQRKFEQASRVFRELERRNAKAGSILLDNDARPDRVVVRMK